MQVSILPRMASQLLIGGLPETRAPLLLALCVLTCALLLSAYILTRRAQDLAAIRDDFTSSVSHELRTPLAEIMVYAEMLQLGRVNAPGERSHAVSVIVREARHLTHLIDNVLLFSRASREQPTAPPAHPLPLAPHRARARANLRAAGAAARHLDSRGARRESRGRRSARRCCGTRS